MSSSIAAMRECLIDGDLDANVMPMKEAVPTDNRSICDRCPFQYVCKSTDYVPLTEKLLKETEQRYEL